MVLDYREAGLSPQDRLLCDYAVKLTLAPGEARTVRIALNSDAFALWNLDMEEVVEPGLFDIMVGPDSENLQTVTLEII